MTPISILVKASLVLGVAAMVQALAGRRLSAATRHLIWTLAISGLLLLPMLSGVLPSWTAVRLTAPGPAASLSSTVHGPQSTETAQIEKAASGVVWESSSPVFSGSIDKARTALVRTSWALVLAAVYAAGVLLLIARLIVEQWSVQRLACRATEVSDPEWTHLFLECAELMEVHRPVRLLRSPDQTMPMAFGVRQSTILIPVVADMWSEDRRRAVLLHELAHVVRHDCLTQMMAAVACAFYWIHPGVWGVARRLRIERELACDDRVLAAGAHARDYAGHLLELAYSLGGQRSPAVAVSMARPRELEGRMLAVLDAARNRTTLAFRGRLAGLAILGAVLVPVAAATTSLLPANADQDTPSSAAADRAPDGIQPAASGADQDALPGTWSVRPAREPGMINVRVTDADGSFSATVAVKSLVGTVPADFLGALDGTRGPAQFAVQFVLKRDAGSFAIDGVVRNRVGAGTFTLTLDPAFADALTKRGFARPTATEQRLLARADIGFAFLDELTTQRYARPSLPELVRAAQHGVNLMYLREMGQLGYRLERIEALIEQRNHGVDPEYIRGMTAAGLPRLSAADLIRARNHGVDPEYIRGLKELGYSSLDLAALIRLRNQGIDPEYIRGLKELGRGSLDLEALIRLRNHGVDPEYIREFEALGFKGLSLDALIDARNQGIDPSFVQELRALGYTLTLDQLRDARNHGVDGSFTRELSALGYQRLPLETLIRLRNQGVDPSYVKELQALGYSALSLEDLVALRNHGVSADRVRSANARAGKRLTVNELTAAASRGWR